VNKRFAEAKKQFSEAKKRIPEAKPVKSTKSVPARDVPARTRRGARKSLMEDFSEESEGE
jgi:hypothetical protein